MSIQYTILFSTTYLVLFASLFVFLCIGIEKSLARSQAALILCGVAFVSMVISLFTK
jgi:hypothetical protein